MEFTNDPLNHNVLGGGGAGAGVAIAGGAGAGQPYVIPAHPCHVLIKMRNEFPTQQNARCQLRFGNLFQKNMPFLRGLNDECAIEAERIGTERDIEELRDRQIIPKQLPPVGQEPVILKLVQHHTITQEEMSRLLQQQAETFQSQIRQLQENKGSNLFDEDRDDDRHLQQVFDYASDRPAPRIYTLEQRLANKIAKRIAKAKERCEDAELNRAMCDLSLNDHDNPMDTSNAIRGVPIELVQASKSTKLAKVVKIPAIKPSINITKTELINLLKLAEIKKIIQEIIYKILENYESAPQEQPEVQEEYLGPMAIDIDVARLKNTKDLLAINGNVNGIDIQCLADSCPELKLKADKSIKHSITGASESSETLGIVKNVLIELLPGCIIEEDLVVLKGHITLTCNNKDYFIPIIPDANRT
ncbi:hypothetical protein RclHR1_20240008 [Rhizophagus clarus]|uniref:Uncharacterized protein n=1 Tax=Rhizophagus clarus TaxID=94130 RepID=A0A2Z6QR83_9GLOM|nr:hypothetical protein RclHR1_20240008 [Rhizophagus clarus]